MAALTAAEEAEVTLTGSSGGSSAGGYGAPAAPSYSAPAPAAPSYSAPAPSYSAPAPAQSYGAPEQSYSAPSQSYGADTGSSYGATSGYGDQGGIDLKALLIPLLALLGLSLLFPTYVSLTSVNGTGRKKRSLDGTEGESREQF